MILDERLTTYMNSLAKDNTEALQEIEREALDTFVPIIRKETQEYLKLMLSIVKPKRILEVGAAVGFSSILMATYNPVDCTIDTIENYEPRIPIAKANFIRASLDDRITLYEGDAMEILPKLKGPYDFIFMDAAKGQYPLFFPHIRPLMHSGTVMITDNVLQDGDILESHFAVVKRNRTIHKRVRDYLYELSKDEDFVFDLLPIGDGLCVITVK